MMATVPTTSARGRLRSGSRTSPPTNDRSPHPSYAHSTETSASPNSAGVTGPTAVVKCPGSPCPTSNASRTSSSSAPYFAPVVRFNTNALQRTP